MSISYDNYGVYDDGTSSISPEYPADISAGDLLILSVVNKYPAAAPSTPSGWTLVGSVSGGAGSSGANTGEVLVTAWYKIASGAESGTVSVTITGANASIGVIVKFSNATGNWDIACTGGTDTTAGTTWSVTGAANPGVTAGDMIYCVSGMNANSYSYSTRSISQTGITYSDHTEIGELATSSGDNLDSLYTHHTASSGTATAAPVYTGTAGGSAAYAPCGATLIIRLRACAAGISGDLNLTLSSLSLAGAGIVPVTGRLEATLAALTLAATGWSREVVPIAFFLGICQTLPVPTRIQSRRAAAAQARAKTAFPLAASIIFTKSMTITPFIQTENQTL